MKPFIFRYLITLAIGVILVSFKEPDADTQLFSIGRSKDANEIIYSLNLDNNNKLNIQEPIQVNWLKRTDNDKKEQLTWIQQKFAYGVVYLQKNESYAKFHFAAYSGRNFELKRDKNGVFKVFTVSNGKEVIVSNIYIYITGGTFWVPEIPKIELNAIFVNNGKKSIETLRP